MKCPKCGNEVDTSLCAACPVCRTPLSNTGYQQEIGMQDSFGNVMTVGGNLNQPKPRKKLNRKTIITVILLVVAVNIISCIVYFGFVANHSRTYEEKIELAKEDAIKVVNQQLRYENLNTWYASDCITDDGNNKFIFYCEVYGRLKDGSYGFVQTYVGIELKDKSTDYNYWGGSNIYPYGDNQDYYVAMLKERMKW